MVFLLALIPLFLSLSSAVSLLLGIGVGLIVGNPHLDKTRFWIKKLLAYSIVALGASMNINEVLKVGVNGAFYTVVGISFTLFLGIQLAKKLLIESETSLLISMGTAICGGSAIAALAPVIRAKAESVSISLITVFILNAVALFIFPPIGKGLGLTQNQFGLWSALAIHDTSSVVGAAMSYGQEALKVGTTIKLARAFWIAPVAFLLGIYFNRNKEAEISNIKSQKPWFILGFLVMAVLFTYTPQLSGVGGYLTLVAKKTLVMTLFLIGTTLSKETLKLVGVKPFVYGFLLWVIVSTSSLFLILEGWIR